MDAQETGAADGRDFREGRLPQGASVLGPRVGGGWRGGAGWLLGLYTASQVFAALVMPAIAERSRHRRVVYAVILAALVFPALAAIDRFLEPRLSM